MIIKIINWINEIINGKVPIPIASVGDIVDYENLYGDRIENVEIVNIYFRKDYGENYYDVKFEYNINDKIKFLFKEPHNQRNICVLLHTIFLYKVPEEFIRPGLQHRRDKLIDEILK
jgi:hypothetical protein